MFDQPGVTQLTENAQQIFLCGIRIDFVLLDQGRVHLVHANRCLHQIPKEPTGVIQPEIHALVEFQYRDFVAKTAGYLAIDGTNNALSSEG